jgi:uroporphyrinogen-III synthase
MNNTGVGHAASKLIENLRSERIIVETLHLYTRKSKEVDESA